MADNKSLHEIFEEVGTKTKISDKVSILQHHSSDGLKAILRGAYDTRIDWLVPNSPPPYTPNESPSHDLADSKLEVAAMELGKFANFNGQATNQSRNISQIQRENHFIQLLESLHQTEAELLKNIIKRKLPYKGLTPNLVNQAFPDLLPEAAAQPKK
jgi:hypothetical protein